LVNRLIKKGAFGGQGFTYPKYIEEVVRGDW
jgi:hypothetical protein